MIDEEIGKRKAEYARKIEDGRKIEAFTSMPEYQWYVQHVIMPTIAEYTERILNGSFDNDKLDWINRGMVLAMQMMVETPESFKQIANKAKKDAKHLQQELDNE